MRNGYQYTCRYFQRSRDIDWSDIPFVSLLDKGTGEPPRLNTTVRACWTNEDIRFQFVCEDDHIVASHTKRDDPLYNQDVVEVFIDESNDGRHYKELELSPRNVLFDALIENNLSGKYKVDSEWDGEDIQTNVYLKDDRTYVYDIIVPHQNFVTPPHKGRVWGINFYRIDEDIHGHRTFMAWSPTGKHNFHTPQKFGQLIFDD